MTIDTDCIATISARYGQQGAITSVAWNSPAMNRIELICIDMMLRIAFMKRDGAPLEELCARAAHRVSTLLHLEATRLVVACFDMATLNVAKVPAQKLRGVASEDKEWRREVLLPKLVEYLLSDMIIPEGKLLVVDLGDSAFFSNAQHEIVPVDSSLLTVTHEADFRMLAWLNLPAFRRLSCAICSVDGDEFVALMMYLPDCESTRPVWWIRDGDELQMWDIRLIDHWIRQDFLLCQWEVNQPITDYCTLFLSFMLLRGCDFVESLPNITFPRMLQTFFKYVRQCGCFVYGEIDPATRERRFHIDYRLFRRFVQLAYGLTRGHECSLTDDAIRCRAARLMYCLHYMANAWNKKVVPLDALERVVDPERDGMRFSKYGVELVNAAEPVSYENIQLASVVIV